MLIARWLRQTTEAEMHAGYHTLLEAAVEHACPYWLIDTRRREHANQQGSQWMMDEFFPLLPQRLPGGPVFLAYLFQPSHLRDLETDARVPSLSYFEGRPYRVQRFSEEQAAVAWLDAAQRAA